ncbi:MAG: hypothetical protein H6737_16145 [Alphaproteobacteria bacterium]|nr:hypothetical protein [Alphaproteobacteria bacterium]
MRTILPLLAITLPACAPLTEENAPDRTAQLVCRKERQCDRDDFDDLWGDDFQECVDDLTDFYEGLLSFSGLLGLELDLEELRSCHADIRRASCDEWNAGDVGPDCNDVIGF